MAKGRKEAKKLMVGGVGVGGSRGMGEGGRGKGGGEWGGLGGLGTGREEVRVRDLSGWGGGKGGVGEGTRREEGRRDVLGRPRGGVKG